MRLPAAEENRPFAAKRLQRGAAQREREDSEDQKHDQQVATHVHMTGAEPGIFPAGTFTRREPFGMIGRTS
jgi:hypothetical protein